MTDLHQGLPYPRRIFAALAISAGSLLLMIDASIAGVVLPIIAQELNVEGSEVVLIVTTYQLILAMALLPLAALGERIGHRRLYCAGLMLHGLAATLCFLVESLPGLVAVRALQALGTAAAMSVAFGLIRLVYPSEQLGKGLALNTIANASGTALAPVAGGLIVSVSSWQWVFMAAIPFSILVLLFSRAMPESKPHPRPFDLRGAALCAATFGLVISGLELSIHGPSLFMALTVIALGIAVAWLFVLHEIKEPHPVLPIDLLARPQLALALISSLSGVLGSMTVLLYMPFRLHNGFDFSPGEIGGLLASYAAASVMITPLSGYLSDRISVAVLCTTGMTIALVGLLCLVYLPEQPGHFDISWRLWLCGAGFGMFFAPNARLIIGSAPTSRAASAGSLVSTTRMLGQATGATLVAGLLALGFGDSSVPFLVAMVLVGVAGAISVVRLLTENSDIDNGGRATNS